MYESILMIIVEFDWEVYDLYFVYVFYILYISLFVLVLIVFEKEWDEGCIFELASGGFSLMVWLAKSLLNMWIFIFW